MLQGFKPIMESELFSISFGITFGVLLFSPLRWLKTVSSTFQDVDFNGL